MHPYLASFVGWARPLRPDNGLAAVARALGHNTDACRMRALGRCPGREQCADCHWAEGSGDSRRPG